MRPPSCMPLSASAAASRMKVTAEGVETAEQQLFLRAAGVHSMQGYRFGRPGSPNLISASPRDARRAPQHRQGRGGLGGLRASRSSVIPVRTHCGA